MSTELIKQKIQEIKSLENINQQEQGLYRTKFRKLLLEIEELGGYLGLGYKNAGEYYQGEFGDRYSALGTSVYAHNACLNYEILLKIPIGTYGYNDLEGLRNQFVFSQQGKYSYCKINNAEKVILKWRDICFKVLWSKVNPFVIKADKMLFVILLAIAIQSLNYIPTGQEIHGFSGSKVKKKLTSDKYYRKREQDAKEELELAKAQIIQLKQEIKLLKEEKEEEIDLENNPNVSFLARMKIAELMGECESYAALCERLKAENEQLKAKLKLIDNGELIINN